MVVLLFFEGRGGGIDRPIITHVYAWKGLNGNVGPYGMKGEAREELEKKGI